MSRHEIQVLRVAKLAQRAVAAATDISVRSLRRTEHEAPVTTSETATLIAARRIGRPSIAPPWTGMVETWLGEDPTLPGVEILRRLREEHACQPIPRAHLTVLPAIEREDRALAPDVEGRRGAPRPAADAGGGAAACHPLRRALQQRAAAQRPRLHRAADLHGGPGPHDLGRTRPEAGGGPRAATPNAGRRNGRPDHADVRSPCRFPSPTRASHRRASGGSRAASAGERGERHP